MADKLYLFRNDEFLGTLDFTNAIPDNDFVFRYDDAYFSSRHFPLDGISFDIGKAVQEMPANDLLFYLDSLLPDGQRRADLASRVHIDATNVGGLLFGVAGDCIGDLAFVRTKELDDFRSTTSSYDPMDAEDFDALLTTRDTTLLTIEKRISLFGAQDKTALYKDPFESTATATGWCTPSSFAPSNYLIKTPSRIHRLNINEYICTRLADLCWIDVPKVYLYGHEDPLLISARYDRAFFNGRIERLHQEDIYQLSQSRGYYENSGGPSVNDVVSAIARLCSSSYSDVRQFMGTFFFNYLIGNVDAHGRNFSILVAQDASIRLAPSYDLTSANLYYSRGDMAMRFGREYQEGNVSLEDFAIFCQQCTIDEKTGHQVYDGIVEDIANNVDMVCAEAKEQCGSDFCDTMREHLKQQLELKGGRFV